MIVTMKRLYHGLLRVRLPLLGRCTGHSHPPLCSHLSPGSFRVIVKNEYSYTMNICVGVKHACHSAPLNFSRFVGA